MSEQVADYTKFRITHNHPEIGRGRLITPHWGRIKVGGLVTFDLTADITIEDDVEISEGVYIFTHRHHWRNSQGPRRLTQYVTAAPLVICEDAFIGVAAIIVGVSRIGRGAIIGAGAKIKREVGDFEVWDGNPAVCIGRREDKTK